MRASHTLVETADAHAATATVANAASHTSTDAGDTQTATAVIGVAAASSTTDAADTPLAASTAAVVASASTADASDASSATLISQSGLTTTDASDATSASASAAVVASHAAVDAADIASASASLALRASGASVDAADSTSATVAASLTATSATQDAADSAFASLRLEIVVTGVFAPDEGDLTSATASPVAAGGVTPADLWGFEVVPGRSAAQVVLALYQSALDLARVHGLVAGQPLVVTPTSRAAGPLAQTFTDDGVLVTVERTDDEQAPAALPPLGTDPYAAGAWAHAIASGMSAASVLELADSMAREVAAINGLRKGSPLRVAAANRSAAGIVQSIGESGTTTTVERLP